MSYFRKSINGLAAIIESDTDLPLGSGDLFLFTKKQHDKIKVLYWDKTVFALWGIAHISPKSSFYG
uniref:Mobile element protein n=1 Tax=Enterovibrio norvegicus TaxID=188144 RepID=A0A0H4A0R4_9GAMM|nr:Mobile element protein [Enterovibrio norvegicus]